MWLGTGEARLREAELGEGGVEGGPGQAPHSGDGRGRSQDKFENSKAMGIEFALVGGFV